MLLCDYFADFRARSCKSNRLEFYGSNYNLFDGVNLMGLDNEEDEDRRLIDRLYETAGKTEECKKITSILTPLVQNVESSDTAKGFLKLYAPILENRFRKSRELMPFFREDSKLRNGEFVTFRKAFVYLGLFETSLTNNIDLILMLFGATHHDFYVPWKRMYATSLEHLDHASLSEKLDFLNRHDLQLFSQNINRKLRNKIAHMEFEIKPDGKISVGNQTFDLEMEIARLMTFLLIVTHAMEDSGVPKLLAKLS